MNELARRAAVPAKTIYHWLEGHQPRKVEHLCKVCDVLEVSLDEVYGRQTAKPASTALSAGVYEVVFIPISPGGNNELSKIIEMDPDVKISLRQIFLQKES